MIYLELLWTFFKIGAFTFGGGYAMLPLIQSEVINRSWLTEQELVDFLAVSESTPGSFAVNVATYVGAEVGGLLGAFAATAGVVLPSFVIILVVAGFFAKFKSNKTVEGCMTGLRPAVVGLIGAAVISVGKTAFFPDGLPGSVALSSAFGYRFWCSAAIFALMLLLIKKKAHPILIILISALLGVAVGYAGEFFLSVSL